MTVEAKDKKDSNSSIITVEHITGGTGLFLFVFVVWWLAGVVLAKGFWSVAFAICMPPYAMYLLVERVMIMMGMV